MKTHFLVTAFVVSLFLLSFSTLATEYDDPVLWYYHTSFGDVVQSMHDCSEDGGHCMAVVWNDNYNRLEAFYTPNPNSYTSWCPQHPSSCSRTPTQTISVDFPFARWNDSWSNWHMGFGVVFSPSANRYYVWKNGQVYYMPINGTEETLIQDYTSGGAYDYRIFIAQGEDDAGEPFLWAFDGVINSLLRYYPYNDTFLSEDYLTGHSWSSVCVESCAAGVKTGYNWIRWYYARNSLNESGYLVYNYSRSGTPPYWSIVAIQKNMPSGFNSTAYYMDGLVYGNRENYPSATDGIYTSTTSDFLTYGTPLLYYAYNTSVNEDINASWGLRSPYYKLFQFDRERNTSGTDWGMGFNRDVLTSLTVATYYLGDCIGLACVPYSAQMNMRVECRDINYTSATTFSNMGKFYIPCSTNVTIVLDTLDYNPYHSETTIDLPCNYSGSENIISFHLRPVYDFPFYAYDSITYEPIPNVVLILNGVSRTTDANGRATYKVDPMVDTNLTFWSTEGTCGETYRTVGDTKDYSLTATNPEYSSYTESFDLFDYPDYKNIYLDPKGINIYVRIRREDGREVFPDDSGVTRIQGADTTYWYSYQKFQSEFADKYPARFLLVDNRSTFEVNLTFSFAGTVYDTFQYEGADYTSFNVSQDQTYTLWFVIPTVQPCERNEDCLASYCDQSQNIFYSLTGCISNICVYSPTECVFYCDDLIGCYKTKTTQTCNTTFDCDSVCTGNYTAEIGFCASDGFCVLEKYVCDNPCENYEVVTVGGNKTIGMCPEVFGCYIGGGTVQRFLFNVVYSGETVSVNEIDTRFYCSLYNKGTKECITGITIPTSATLLNTIPDNWAYTTVETDYVFQDISISCSDSCNITYEYCMYGCNPATKTCNIEPTSPEGQVRNILVRFRGWWYALLPTLYDRTIGWVIVAFALASVIEYFAGGKLGRGMGVMFGFVMMGFLLGGVLIDQVVFEIAFVFTIIAGLIVWRVWNQAKVG